MTATNDAWRQFASTHPPALGMDSGIALATLEELAAIQVSGADAESFLQSQFSNDITRLRDGDSQLTSYCTPQGRIVALFRALRFEQGYLLLLPTALAQSVRDRLARFVLRADVTLTVVTDEANWFGLVDEADNANVAADESIECIRIDDQRRLFIGQPDAVQSLWRKLAEQARLCDWNEWRSHDIAVGIPSVYDRTSETFIPQMLNLELIGGVDFDKGCYPGQEIVARTQYLGRIKRRMFALSANSTLAANAGDEIVDTDGNAVGTVVDSVQRNGAEQLLAVISLDASDRDVHHLQAQGAPLNRAKLPYDLPANTGD